MNFYIRSYPFHINIWHPSLLERHLKTLLHTENERGRTYSKITPVQIGDYQLTREFKMDFKSIKKKSPLPFQGSNAEGF